MVVPGRGKGVSYGRDASREICKRKSKRRSAHKIGRGAVDARHVSSKGKERSAAYGRHMGTTTES